MPGEIAAAIEPLYRLGRAPDPLAWPEPRRAGTHRYDDPSSPPRYLVLYAAERRACFYESLAKFRPPPNGPAVPPVTPEWLSRHVLGSFRIHDPEHRLRFLDMRSEETYADFRHRFALEIREAGYADFDLMAAASDRRTLTQPIGLWAYQAGFHGIRYPTRHTPDLNCWAIFNHVTIDILTVSALTRDDLDFRAVCDLWNLPLPGA